MGVLQCDSGMYGLSKPYTTKVRLASLRSSFCLNKSSLTVGRPSHQVVILPASLQLPGELRVVLSLAPRLVRDALHPVLAGFSHHRRHQDIHARKW